LLRDITSHSDTSSPGPGALCEPLGAQSRRDSKARKGIVPEILGAL